MRQFYRSLCGAALVLTSASAVSARDYQQEVQVQLLAAGAIYSNRGFELATDPYFAQLNADQTDSLELYMNDGSYYNIIGACDNDCSDIDLVLYDENNNEISRDTQTDGTPIVEVTPRWSGTFTLMVRMYNCQTNPCHYGVMMMKK